MTYNIKYKVNRPGKNKPIEYWLKIGQATSLDSGNIICTLDCVPLHWDGVMTLMPRDEKANED